MDMYKYSPFALFARYFYRISFVSVHIPLLYGVSAGKRDQIDKKIFFEIINVLDQMIKSTSILLRNFFLKKNSIWSLFPAPTPYYRLYNSYHFLFVFHRSILTYFIY